MLIRLQGYVLREVAKVLILAVLGVAAMILLALCVRLLRDGLKPEQLRGIVLYLLPFTLPFAVPCGMLIAAVMSFGRLAGDNELLAIRSSGINLWSVTWPVVILGLALTGGAELLDNNVLPWCQGRVAEKRDELIGPWLERLGSGVHEVTLPPYEVHIGSVDPERPSLWRSVVAVKYADVFVSQLIVAKTGSWTFDANTQRGVLTLTNGYMIQPFSAEEESYVSFPGDMSYAIDTSKDKDVGPPKNAQLTLGGLITRRAELASKLKGPALGSRLRSVSTEIERALGRVEKDLSNLAEKQKEAAAEMDRLNTEVARQSSQKASLETRRKTAEDDIEAKKKLVALHAESIDELKHATNSMPAKSQRRVELAAQISAIAAKQAETQKSIDDLEATVKRAATDLAAVADSPAKNQDAAGRATRQKADLDRTAAAKTQDRSDLILRKRQADTEGELMSVKTQIQFRISQGVACFVFALLGIPLGIMARRGGVMVPVGISFAVIICLYYPVYTMGRQMAESGFIPPYIAMWLSNLICGVMGIVLMIRTLRS